MNNPKVSVIITYYNQDLYIKDALNSVILNTYKNWECIIIDDGSCYDSSIVAHKLAKEYDNVKYIKQNNQGVCIARNNAIRNSLGDYILCLDADDKISNRYIELCVDALDSNDNVSLVTTNYEYFGEKKGKVYLEDYSIEKLMWRNLFINCSMFRRSDFDRVGGFNENMFNGLEDWDLWLGILKNGSDVKYIDGIHFFYRQYAHSKSRNQNAMRIRPQLVMQVKRNHSDLYLNKYSSAIYSHEYIAIRKSWAYTIGKFLIYPIKLFSSLINSLIDNK